MICTTLIVCGILFWPTFYRYDKIGGKLPVRVNRITGYTEILYPNRGWEPVRNAQTIPRNERNNVKVLGYFDSDKRLYNGEIYNGTNYTLKKIRLSIGAKYGGKMEWQKIYETPIDIAPFSKGSCSINLIDWTRAFGPADYDLSNAPADNKTTYTKDQLIHEAIGYAKEYGVDPDIYLSVINQGSQFNPDAKSPTGVRGISQIPLEKGKAYGILNTEDRANPDKMLRAGAAYLRDLFNEKGNWPDALSAYNGGSDPDYLLNVAKHLPWARKQLSNLETKASHGHIIPKNQIVFDEPTKLFTPEVKLEEIFGYEGE